ncbi:MAG: thioredoxin domain-containing protein [Terracidiphilus sp.]
MIRLSIRLAGVAALVALSLLVFEASAQQQVPPAPAQDSSAAPPAPAPAAAPIFPKPDPANFTAATPTKEAVDDFLRVLWGYDDTRMWQVWAIQKTPVEGISKVIVLAGDRTGKQKPMTAEFFALPDGKHIFADNDIVPFGEHPFAEYRAQLQQRADGFYRGSAMKDLELVEFADFQCPHCKEAQANMDKLAVDFPKARIVFQSLPLPQHPAAANAAAYGICVGKEGGSNAFFTFAAAVYDGQDGLATADGATLTLNSAVVKAGLDPAKIAACAATPAVVAQVRASVKLAQDLDINQTPMLMVNGRQVPLGGISYDVLKQVVQYQEKLDGIAP